MIQKRIYLIIISFVSVISYAQEYEIKGKVEDEAHLPLAYAEVFLKNSKDSLITYAFSDDEGKFVLSVNSSETPYKFSIEQFGQVFFEKEITLKSDMDLGLITVNNSVQLEEVTIIGTKKIIEQVGNKTYFNVQNSKLTKGNSADELLTKIPKVSGGGEDGFQIKNKSAVVLVNGRRMNLSAQDLKTYLSTLNSEDVARIEVEETASSDQDASVQNGVINIVLKKNPQGFRLVSKNDFQYYTQNHTGISSNWNLNYGGEKFYTYANLNWSKKNYEQYTETHFFYKDGNKQHSKINANVPQNYKNVQLGMVYYINDKNEIGLEGTLNQFEKVYEENLSFTFDKPTSENIYTTGKSDAGLTSKNKYVTLNFLHKLDDKGSQLKFLADVGQNEYPNLSDIQTKYKNKPSLDNHTRIKSQSNSDYYSMQLDYTQKFADDWTFDAGVKNNHLQRNNYQNYYLIINDKEQAQTNKNQDFVNEENILSGYTSISKKWENHFIKVGLRMENTNTQGINTITNEKVNKNYNDWFPSVYYRYQFNRNLSANASYRKSITRPSFRSLNPYVFKSSDFQYDKGNPNLKPFYTRKFEIGLDYKKNSLSLAYTQTKDMIRHIYKVESGKINIFQPINFGSERLFQADYALGDNITKWLYLNASVGYLHSIYAIDEGDFYNNEWYNKVFARVILPKNFAFEVKSLYRSDFVDFNSQMKGYYLLGLMIEKRFWNENFLLRLKTDDIFNNERLSATTHFSHFDYQTFRKRSTRSFTISLQYTFDNHQKMRNKKIESSDDTRGRL